MAISDAILAAILDQDGRPRNKVAWNPGGSMLIILVLHMSRRDGACRTKTAEKAIFDAILAAILNEDGRPRNKVA